MQTYNTSKENRVKNSGKYYASLTGVRAIAAFLVFFVHYNPINNSAPAGSLTRFFYNIVCHFHIGVSIFFVLSGFLITSRYQQGLQLSWRWVRRYIQNRFSRIYPLYFLVTILTAIVSQVYVRYDPSHLWSHYNAKDKVLVLFLNFTLLRGFFDRFLLTIVGQGWSLTVEECFYLSAPLLIIGLRWKHYRLFAYPLMLLGVGAGLVILCAPFHEQLYGFFGSFKFMLNWTFFGRCLEFLFGMSLALVLSRQPAASMQSLHRGWLTVLGLTWISICLCALVYFERSVPASQMGHDLISPGAIITRNAVLPIGVVCLFWGLIREQSWLRRILETKLFDLLGRSSYAFYLIHGGVINFLLNDFVSTNILIKFLLTNVFAVILYKAVEHPLHKLLAAK